MTTQNNRNSNSQLPGSFNLIKGLQKKILWRSALVFLTIILTLVLVFALTVAWHTNVVQTGGLTFSAETWNFNGEIVIGDEVFNISPGASGVISMSFKNESNGLVAASVTVSKDQLLQSALKSKLFFYIDTSVIKNGESVDKVYISKSNSYTYVAFPYSELDLTEGANNAPILKWEWVYDKLGYYVLGTETDNGGVTIEEYIRPIEYEYDEMKTTFDANGNLITIDGTTTADEFLTLLSASDGYDGVIDSSQKTAGGYYPVAVKDGYGVWAYLCSYSEIQTSSEEDTAWGTNGVSLGNVRVTVTGVNSKEKGQYVSTEADFVSALNGGGISVVTLANDISLTQSIVLTDASVTMIDLNGHKLVSGALTIIDANPGASVMVYNGDIEGAGQAASAVTANGANVILNRVDIVNVGEGIEVFDYLNDLGKDSNVRLTECTITAFEDGLWIKANGGDSEKNAQITIENCTIIGEKYSGILCNGTYYGVDLNITSNSIIKGYHAGIYFPAKDSTLNIENSTLEGNTGLVVKGGLVNVVNSTVKGIGTSPDTLPDDPADLPLSGWIDTCDGIYLEANYTGWETQITVSGDDTLVTSVSGLAVRQYPTGDNYEASIIIKGGAYSSDVTSYLENGYVCIKDGSSYKVKVQ